MTIGVYNDFLQSTSHSDELWFQGGGRLCYNVGSWDSELNTIIGTPGAGASHGGVKHEWRINNSTKMTLNRSGDLGINTTSPNFKLDVNGTARISGNVRGDSFKADAEFKTFYSTVVKHGGVLAMDDFTWRRVVPQRFSGFIVWTPVANDHFESAYLVLNNSNAGAGSRDWCTQNDYCDSNKYISSRYNGVA
jgi:hypothetical protein